MTDASLHLSNSTRKRMTTRDARLRTLRVKATRIFFIAGAAASVLGLVGSVLVRWVQTASLPSAPVVQGENLVIDKPRFVGNAKDGSKIVVTAQTATRSVAADNAAVQLVKPVLETSDGSKAIANSGIWSQAEQTLALDGDVVLTRQGGDRATSAKALWSSSTSKLEMQGGVVLSRQDGDQANANSAIWSTEPSQLSMSGGVTLSRPGGDQVTASEAVWSTNPAQLVASGNVVLNRAGGARTSSQSAIWRSDIGTLDLAGAANIVLPTGESASAQSARWEERLGNIVLNGQAVVRFSAGQASSARATYSGLTGQLRGDGGIQISSSLGTGSADRYVYETRSKRLTMSGNARATLQ
jgi:hypothetical protein